MPPAVVNLTDDFLAWLKGLDAREQKDVLHVIKLLELAGYELGFPHSSALKGTQYPLRELRPKSGSSPLRPIYAFDPKRAAVLLIGGDKGSDKHFYERVVRVAERLLDEYLQQLAKDEEDR